MPARTGAEFLDRLSRTRTHVEIEGETLTGGVADHPAFRNVAATYAGLFDLQHDHKYRNILTYQSPTTGEPDALAPPEPHPGPGLLAEVTSRLRAIATPSGRQPPPALGHIPDQRPDTPDCRLTAQIKVSGLPAGWLRIVAK